MKIKKVKLDINAAKNLLIHDWITNGIITDNLKDIVLNGFKGLNLMLIDELSEKIIDAYDFEMDVNESVPMFVDRKKKTIPNYLD